MMMTSMNLDKEFKYVMDCWFDVDLNNVLNGNVRTNGQIRK